MALDAVSLQRRLCALSAIRHFGVASLYIDRIACQVSSDLLGKKSVFMELCTLIPSVVANET
jgi:hypothetical protein